jgi:hypothetical protein
MAVPLPEVRAITEFHHFIDTFVIPPIREQLDDFDYSYSEWYNHLTTPKQRELKDIQIENIPPSYNFFCKREVQSKVDGLPKNRAIGAAHPSDKFTIGPVAWALESVMDEHFDGYCGGKNWDNLEATISQNYKDGYRYIVQGDGSGFDRTQSHEVKYLDRKIYSLVEHSIHHVDKTIYTTKTQARYRKVSVGVFEGNTNLKLDSATLDATVSSGSPDTTLMNTCRMATYCRFMLHQAHIEGRVLAKGDDFVIFIQSPELYPQLKEQFDKYWSKKGENLGSNFGLGLTLKFLTFGDYTTFDFCSTHLICDFRNEIFKIVRQWDRIHLLGGYSIKALAYSTEIKNQYIEDICKAMEHWTNDMPFYTEYIRELRAAFTGPRKALKKTGISKLSVKNDNHRYHHGTLIQDQGYGRDYNYSLQLRTSKTRIDDSIVKQFFEDKYGLTYSEQPWLLH